MIGEVSCNGAPPEAEVFGSIRRAGDRGRAKTESETGTEFGNGVLKKGVQTHKKTEKPNPLIPFAQQIPADIFALSKSDSHNAQQDSSELMESSFQRTVAVQTDYRESETQTDPYSPEYILHPGAAIPEILTLATFSWGKAHGGSEKQERDKWGEQRTRRQGQRVRRDVHNRVEAPNDVHSRAAEPSDVHSRAAGPSDVHRRAAAPSDVHRRALAPSDVHRRTTAPGRRCPSRWGLELPKGREGGSKVLPELSSAGNSQTPNSTMAKTKDMSKDTRNKIVDLHQAGKTESAIGHGLPAGLDEVEMIERARMKRAWEATLPPLNDLSQLDKRKRMMDEMERKEWAFREQEIEKLQETRLALLMRFLRERDSQQDKVTVQRLDEHFSKLQREKEKQVQKIRNNYERSLRKLIAKRKTLEEKLVERDIINKHSDYSSQTYAPLSRHGVFPDRHSQSNVIKSHFLDTYQGLLELETGLPPSVLEPKIKAPRSKKNKGFISRSDRQEILLLKTHQALKDKKVQVEEKKPLRFLYRVEKPVPRPPTPVVDVPPEGDGEKELAVIFLQKLLRGRSIQNQMLKGVEKHLELIQELRTTHTLQREEQELQRADKQVTQALQRQRELSESRLTQIQSYVDGLSGEVIGDMLDFLSKELVRLQEERRIHAFMLLAERDRCLREAEESGRRQVEERRRREEDEIFRQVMKVHQATVDLYLEDVILDSIDQTAEAQAREEIHHVAEKLNNITYAMEEMRNNDQSEAIVAQLVYSFLIPEVHKVTTRKRVKQRQRRHLTAAHTLIHGTHSSSASPCPLSPESRASTSLLSQIVKQVVEASHNSDDHQENEHTD
ncbi:hypothetical protein QTP70_023212 [Hemibagrus guttatus]|uniref:Cilia- and flagella-associated protein 91 n=1 Tax=Hemibagrus guttatus TaxID=175788 RepID=A0AAE0R5S9_9TELE|nr:hypothetical protein QTP70_023212 [Hemibagrus guttatus]